MKIETLKDRIKKTEEKVAKINTTLERHKSQLNKKSSALTNKGINLENYDKYDREKIDHDTYWELCDYEHKLEDIENNEKKLKEACNSLTKLVEQLNNQIAKEKNTNNLIPEVLNIFLENWKQKCIEFYTTLANEYITLIAKEHTEYEITKEELDQLKKKKYNSRNGYYETVNMYNEEVTEKILSGNIKEYEKRSVLHEIRHRHIETFKSSHFASDIVIISKIIDHEEINYTILNNILDEDVKIKKEQFISRIKEVIGEIKDLTGLTISSQGEINGIAKGIKCNAKVETITVGGYNVQCFHYRVLVNTIK